MGPPASFPTRPRAKFHRSRDGCLGCRSRRKKCDGGRPTCLSCEQRSVPCRWPESSASDIPSSTTPEETEASSSGRSQRAALGGGRMEKDSMNYDHKQEKACKVEQSPDSEYHHSDRSVHKASISTISSPAAARSQTGAVAATHIGPDASLRESSPIWGLLASYPGNNDAFTLAFDALSLTQLGVVRKDQRLLNQAIASYHRAIHKLQGELMRAASLPEYPATLLGTPYLLFLCERFTPIASLSNSSAGVTAHLTGFAHLLRSKRAGKSNVQLLLLDDFQQYSLAWSMVHRRQLSRQMPESDVKAIEKLKYRFPRMTQHMMNLPDFFEEADELSFCAANHDADKDLVARRTVAFLAKLERHHRELDDIFETWMEQTSCPTYQQVEAHLLSSGNKKLDSLSRSAFGTAFVFPSFGAAVAHLRYWMTIVILRDLECQVRSAVTGKKWHDRAMFREEATLIVDKICKMAIYLCALHDEGSHSLLCVTGVLQYIWPWYAADCQIQKLAWCDALCKYLQAGGMYLPVP